MKERFGSITKTTLAFRDFEAFVEVLHLDHLDSLTFFFGKKRDKKSIRKHEYSQRVGPNEHGWGSGSSAKQK
ncbi:hypothetical protein NUITMVRE34_00650 [Enterococcus gallinarum]|uniref:hypothetical protein n=1 Tax=Enterococcus TaxID=1350 RepID=UPI0001B6B4B6|nr:hypothetical protein [Enterococcus sp. FDAARGOS_553]EEV31501.1 predicted protein [Enterococcus gallinarum EG2]GMG57712.1 hypothetical protein AH4_11340 [Enterococcus gallinarum]GMS46785.1 hypothetical protein NUITMVRE34_00650 [Enterococcus gallinarum]GMS50417.1 hypothetical protein NUITMVRE35_05520 [Enterococcus gallinarum]